MSLHYFHISHPDLMSKDIILPTIDKPLLKFFECSMGFPIFSPSTSISPNSSLKSTYTSRKFFNRCTLHSIFQILERFQEKHIHRHNYMIYSVGIEYFSCALNIFNIVVGIWYYPYFQSSNTIIDYFFAFMIRQQWSYLY